MGESGPPNRLVAWRRRMGFFTDLLRSRVLPALVAAVGVSFIAAGLLSYTTGTEADAFAFGPVGSPGASPSQGDNVQPTDQPGPSGAASPFPLASGSIAVLPSPVESEVAGSAPPPSAAAPSSSPDAAAPSPAATPVPAKRTATRVVIPALDIDLAVVRPPGGPTTYPLCDVAMFIQSLSQPGLPGATYVYAHARIGMFLPLLEESRVNDGHAMIGMLVQVYTSDDMYFLYQITEVRRHQLTLVDAVTAQDSQLWLQTSEGPNGTLEKLQVIAMPLSSGPADAKDARPTPHPLVCH
jgi:hypothetical protein